MMASERLVAGLEQLSGSVGQMRADAHGRLAQLEKRMAGVERTGTFCVDALDHALQKIEAALDQRAAERQELAQRDLRVQRKIIEIEESVGRIHADLQQSGSSRRLETLERKIGEALELLRGNEGQGGLWTSLQSLLHRMEALEKDHGDLAGAVRAIAPAAQAPGPDAGPPAVFEPPEVAEGPSPWQAPDQIEIVPDFEDIFAQAGLEHPPAAAPVQLPANPSGSRRWLAIAVVIAAIMVTSLVAGFALFGQLSRPARHTEIGGSQSLLAHIPEPPEIGDIDPGFLSTQQAISSPDDEGSRQPEPVRASQTSSAEALAVQGVQNLDGAAGIPINYPNALKLLGQAAALGQAVAQYRLGTMYELGKGVPADAAKAQHWYELAAGQGNRKAMHNLAVLYTRGSAEQKNMPLAMNWFVRAAMLGLVDSQFNLAVLYERGETVPLSLQEAYKWYSIAAAAGDVESRNRMTVLQSQLSDAERKAAQADVAAFHPVRMVDKVNALPASGGSPAP